jgi:hypothetical protein
MTENVPCRHEYVRIFQRRLKGLERRLVGTKAYLPVGFKVVDFAHLREGAYCFCTRCRARLFPKRTAREKAEARLALAAEKLQAASEFVDENVEDAAVEDIAAEDVATDDSTPVNAAAIHIEELELESTELEDLDKAVTIPDDEESCGLSQDEV